MVIIAIFNGLIRVKFYTKFLGELGAHQLSTISGVFLFGAYFWMVTGKWQIESTTQAVLIGLMWLLITVLFEFVFGHYVMGHPWQKLFSDYNVFKGRLWIVILLWTAVGPYLFYSLRN